MNGMMSRSLGVTTDLEEGLYEGHDIATKATGLQKHFGISGR